MKCSVVVPVLALLAISASAALSPAADAAGRACAVRDTSSKQRFHALQEAVDAAAAGDVLTVRGTCIGDTHLNKNLTIRGVGGATLDGGNDEGLGHEGSTLRTGEATVTVAGLTITGGHASAGAGISSVGSLTLTHTTVEGNTAVGEEGGFGGGIFSAGTLTLDRSQVEGNTGFCGGGIFIAGGTATLQSSRVIGNKANDNGGGLCSENGAVVLRDSKIADNSARSQGGAIANATGSLRLERSTVSNNTAADGGGIFNDSILHHIGKTEQKGAIVLSDSTVSANTARAEPFAGEGDGGGVDNAEGSLTLEGSASIVKNSATLHGGGIYNVESNGSTLTFAIGWTGSVSENMPDNIFDV